MNEKEFKQIEEKLKGRYKMTFEEAIELIEDECRVEAEDGFSTKGKDLDTFLALSIIKNLQETYAQKIKMTSEQKEEFVAFVDNPDDKFENFWFCLGSGDSLYKNKISEEDFMRAWLHPELIEVIDG